MDGSLARCSTRALPIPPDAPTTAALRPPPKLARSGDASDTGGLDPEQRLHHPSGQALETERRVGHGQADAILAVGGMRLMF